MNLTRFRHIRINDFGNNILAGMGYPLLVSNLNLSDSPVCLPPCPYRRVVRSSTRDPWLQTAVRCSAPPPPAAAASGDDPSSSQERSMESGPWDEVTEPLEDALLKRTLDATYRCVGCEKPWSWCHWSVKNQWYRGMCRIFLNY